MVEAARHIPEGLKREVRRKCGFGCIVCGLPVFDYEHIDDFATVREHRIDNIVLLCPNHHREKTAGRMPVEVERRFAAKPFNADRSMTPAHRLHLMVGTHSVMRVGNCITEWVFNGTDKGRFAALEVDGIRRIGVDAEDGFLLLDVLLHDVSGRVALRIERGELMVSTGVWDYRLEGARLKINSAVRLLWLDMEFTPEGVAVDRAVIHIPPAVIDVSPTEGIRRLVGTDVIATITRARTKLTAPNGVGIGV